jgi:hypothetical protein
VGAGQANRNKLRYENLFPLKPRDKRRVTWITVKWFTI